ncbi:MAG: dTDP-4-dehydrorhamnose 3,5-epimerase [Verrucomicrobia bacterium]|nr:dTDP-4-dehydrorhamnose 3,5-epimerase [Verrucomicrobiota bacterium]
MHGVVEITPPVFGDERGFFMETWNSSDFADAGIDASFVQENHSRSVQGTLRGLHYQTQCAQGKLVRVVEGEIFDVVVDLRRWSPSFSQWRGTTLSAESRKLLWIPPGFAHGFYVLSESAEFVYKCTDRYAPEFETTLCWDSPSIGIEWPIPAGTKPILSQKDRDGLRFEDAPVYETPLP